MSKRPDTPTTISTGEVMHRHLHARAYELAASLGLLSGLRAQKEGTQLRCGRCHKMQRAGSVSVWVPDSVSFGDPAWSVTEACRRNAVNGAYTAWCLACAQKLSGIPVNTVRNRVLAPIHALIRRVRQFFAAPLPRETKEQIETEVAAQICAKYGLTRDELRFLLAARNGTLPKHVGPGDADYDVIKKLVDRGYLAAEITAIDPPSTLQ